MVASLKASPASLIAAVVVLTGPLPALAQTCSPTSTPYTLTNGSTANADQVMADLNCPIYGLANYSGFVGIGTTNPNAKFNVYGRTWLDDASGDGGPRAQGLTVSFTPPVNYTNGTDPGDGLRNTSFIASGGQVPVIISLRNISVLPFWDIVMDPSEGPSLKFSRAGYAPTLTLNGGNVGIGTTTPSAPLYVNGAAVITGGYTATSDARLKRDIRPVGAGLDIVMRLEPVRYTWRPPEEREVGKDLDLPLHTEQVGFLAQALEKVVPEAVKVPAPGSDQTYSIDETKLIPFLVQAIKEQQQALATQDKEIAELKQNVARLERHKPSHRPASKK